MNLTDANLKGSEVDPVWFELYQAKQEYGLDDLSPQSMDTLFQRMVTDDALFQLYFKYTQINFIMHLNLAPYNMNFGLY